MEDDVVVVVEVDSLEFGNSAGDFVLKLHEQAEENQQKTQQENKGDEK